MPPNGPKHLQAQIKAPHRLSSNKMPFSGRCQDWTGDFHDVNVASSLSMKNYKFPWSSFNITTYINENIYQHLSISINFYNLCLPNYLPIYFGCQHATQHNRISRWILYWSIKLWILFKPVWLPILFPAPMSQKVQ